MEPREKLTSAANELARLRAINVANLTQYGREVWQKDYENALRNLFEYQESLLAK